MDGQRLRRAMDLFKQVCVLDAPSRSAFLDAHCADDADLRSRVEALLHEDSRSANPLDAPGAGIPLLARQLAELTDGSSAAPALTPPNRPPVPVLSGDYRIIRVVGEGGMGTVYEAEQSIPRRRVALKAIRHGMASPDLVRRFEHEAHILGRLHHPGIAQIYEAGAADAEHPHLAFIAMEYVEGLPITEHAEAANMDVRARVELIVKACDAVHHAHQRGVIHRDLKPTNLLIDASGQPKVLDFGVARAIDSAATDLTTMHTQAGQLVGTLAYMSPEQVGGDPDEVDLRSDVYSLGVMLFRLLAGRLPYELIGRSVAEMGRIICAESPSQLSAFNRECRGDLDTIAAKALEKDKERRYQSAADLQMDLRAYLTGEAISARGDSALYVLRKNLRRYQLGVVAASCVLVVCIAASIALLRMYRVSQRQAAIARAAQADAQAAEAGQRSEAEKARIAAQRAERVSQFLQRTFRAADPRVAQGAERTVRQALDEASKRVQSELKDDPPVAAAVHDSIGATYMGLGLYPEAEQHYAAAVQIYAHLGADFAAEHADALTFWGGMMQEQGRNDAAEECMQEALTLHRGLYGENHSAIAADLSALGALRRVRGDLDGAEHLLREALAIQRAAPPDALDEDSGLMSTLNKLVSVLFVRQQWDEAEALARESLQLGLDTLGPRHPNIPLALNTLATVLERKGDPAGAEPLYREALDRVREINGADHVTVSVAEVNLAKLLAARGEYADAESLFVDAVQIRRSGLGPAHPQLALALFYYGDMLLTAHRPADAEPVLREAVQIVQVAEEVDPTLAANTMAGLGACLVRQQRFEEAEPLLLDVYSRLSPVRGAEHPSVLAACQRLAELYALWGKSDEAARWAERVSAP